MLARSLGALPSLLCCVHVPGKLFPGELPPLCLLFPQLRVQPGWSQHTGQCSGSLWAALGLWGIWSPQPLWGICWSPQHRALSTVAQWDSGVLIPSPVLPPGTTNSKPSAVEHPVCSALRPSCSCSPLVHGCTESPGNARLLQGEGTGMESPGLEQGLCGAPLAALCSLWCCARLFPAVASGNLRCFCHF